MHLPVWPCKHRCTRRPLVPRVGRRAWAWGACAHISPNAAFLCVIKKVDRTSGAATTAHSPYRLAHHLLQHHRHLHRFRRLESNHAYGFARIGTETNVCRRRHDGRAVRGPRRRRCGGAGRHTAGLGRRRSGQPMHPLFLRVFHLRHTCGDEKAGTRCSVQDEAGSALGRRARAGWIRRRVIRRS
jgi:hypothetical protein